MQKPRSLSDAKNLAEKYRYTGDTQQRIIGNASQATQQIKRVLSSNGLQITQALTPKLYESLETACKNLKLPVESIFAYVSSLPELQAQCFETDDDNCVINISSGLINLLHADEVTFVIGHEIGHHILKHYQEGDAQASIESLMNQRAKEISVDRAGLIACQSLESSLRATMKVLSGLPDEFIRFDTSNFINQLRIADQQDATLADSLTTHPSLILRARALLWFSMNDEIKLGDKLGSLPLEKINDWVRKDLDRYIDKPMREKITNIENNLFFWTCSKTATLKGKFTREDRKNLIAEFGENNVEKLIAAIEDMNIDEVAEFLNQKIAETSEELARLVPSSISKRIEKIDQKVFNFKES
ncbi:MAG: M48 family metallopeptidase [Alphaproteobacteria bacterium]|nr:M48 family metallopeptidase [Alphaproteobacteria bacterium]